MIFISIPTLRWKTFENKSVAEGTLFDSTAAKIQRSK